MFEEETELCRAVINRDIDEVRTILERDTSQINVGDEDRHSTPLHIASFDGQAHICKLLLEHGANVDACDINGCTPLHEAEPFDPSWYDGDIRMANTAKSQQQSH